MGFSLSEVNAESGEGGFEPVGQIGRETVYVGEVHRNVELVAAQVSCPREDQGVHVLVGATEFGESFSDQGT
jgi:hypothetical protein